ncbi:MAG: hypothetical protein ABSC51_08120 [Gaiellaceae bacterium]
MRRPPPPSGTPPPEQAEIEGLGSVELRPLAGESYRRYKTEFPDERERYGEVGESWYVHDTLWLLSWAALEIRYEGGVLPANLSWLAQVLAARDFPLERLARSLEITAEVASERLGPKASAFAGALLAGSGQVKKLQSDG